MVLFIASLGTKDSEYLSSDRTFEESKVKSCCQKIESLKCSGN